MFTSLLDRVPAGRRWLRAATSRPTASPSSTARRGASGQAVAEFVIVAPVMLMLMLLAVDFGRLFFSYIAVSNAAREATFYAAVNAAEIETGGTYDATAFAAGVTQAATLELANQGQDGEGALTVTGPTCFVPSSGTALACDTAANFAGGIGNHVSVSVSQPFTFLTPLIGDLVGGGLTLTETATAPVLNPASVTIVEDEDFVPPPTSAPEATPTPTLTPTPGITPTPAPTTSPAPGATPTPAPTPTPTPTPTPPPTCVVPDFVGTWFEDIGAVAVWRTEGFTGTLTDDSGGKKIKSQSLAAGSTVLCSSAMTVTDSHTWS